MPRIRLSVTVIREDDGTYSAFCEQLEGCMTQGATLEEVRDNIIDAIKLNVEHLQATGQSIPTLPAERRGDDLLLPMKVHDILHAGKGTKAPFAGLEPTETFDYILA